MCKDTQHLKFCTCQNIVKTVIHNKNSRRKQDLPPENIIWVLKHYIGISESCMMGMPVQPLFRLSESMTEDYVLSQLNTHTCFDFDYTPHEGDNLTLRNTYGYMSFIYRGNSWVADSYDPFSYDLEKFAEGEVNCRD